MTPPESARVRGLKTVFITGGGKSRLKLATIGSGVALEEVQQVEEP
jgi:hypothetical protein